MIRLEEILTQEIYTDNLEKDFEEIKSEMIADGWELSEFTLAGDVNTIPNMKLTWVKN